MPGHFAIDYDDVCVDSLSPFVEFQNAMFGLNLTPDDYTDDRFWRVWNVSEEEAVRRTFAFHRSGHFDRIEPIDEVYDSLRELWEHVSRRGGDLHVVTA